ncbi:MAG: type IX secretion system membrane protein PorP/SprF [Saprospiraceae bacterium]|nr:type IX secretion system membrane protein PorP/SprF [Bacteroidia bacterium]NNL91501.1 type IX secretion system membrane protein PorP/SprF [Saprospiraceae bacterium]
MKHVLTLIQFLCFTSIGYAQGIYFIESQQIKGNINPAFTGINGSMNFTLIHQEQYWNDLLDFTTIGLSFENSNVFNCQRVDWGVSILHDEEGDGNLSSTVFQPNIVYTVPFKVKKWLHNIRLGLGLSIEYNAIDWTKLTFSDQIDPKGGFIYQTSFLSPSNSNWRLPIPSFGLVYKFEIKNKFSIKSGLSGKFVYEKYNSGFFSEPQLKNNIDWTFFIYPEIAIKNSHNTYIGIEPSLLIQKESSLYNFQLGTKLHLQNAHGIGVFLNTGHPNGFTENIKSLVYNVFVGIEWGKNNQVILSASWIQNIGLIRQFGDTFQVGMKLFFKRNGCGKLNTDKLDCMSFEVDKVLYDHIWLNPGTGKMN